MKKLIALLLSLLLVIGMVACGSTDAPAAPVETNTPAKEETPVKQEEKEEPAEAKEEVTLHLYFDNGNGEQEYTDEVEAKLGEILDTMEGYEHINIDLHPSAANALSTDYALAQTSGDPIDILFTFGMDLNKLVQDGDLMELSELVEAYPSVLSEIPEWLANMGIVDGGRYQIPAYQMAAFNQFFVIPVEYADMYREYTGKTAEDMYTSICNSTTSDKLAFLEEMCLAVREGTGLDTKYVFDNLLPGRWFNCEGLTASAAGGEPLYVILEGQEDAVCWFLSDEYYELAKGFNDLYKKGLIHPDAMTYSIADFRRANQMNDVSFVVDYGQQCMTAEGYATSYKNSYGWDAEAYPVVDHAYIPSTWAAGGPAIYTESEHPEEAMMIIDLLMTRKGAEFYNTLVWGLEGIHYEWVDKEAASTGRIKTLEHDYSQVLAGIGTYGTYPFAMGNSFNSWLNQASADDYHEGVLAIHDDPSTVASPVIGITWDTTSVEDQMAQVQAVAAEYNKIYLSDDFDTKYAEFVEKMEAAGVQDVVDVLNAQLDAFEGK